MTHVVYNRQDIRDHHNPLLWSKINIWRVFCIYISKMQYFYPLPKYLWLIQVVILIEPLTNKIPSHTLVICECALNDSSEINGQVINYLQIWIFPRLLLLTPTLKNTQLM